MISNQAFPSGQEMTGISYDKPAYTIIFIVVDHRGEQFSFLNKLTNKFEFFWDRWGKWKNVLKPLTFHAFLVQSYNTKTSKSTQGFTPVKHIMEFHGIHEARAFNMWYLEQYRRWNATASAEMATEEVLKFENKMFDFAVRNDSYFDNMMEQLDVFFADKEFLEMMEFVLSVSESPNRFELIEQTLDDLKDNDPFHYDMLEYFTGNIGTITLDTLRKDPQAVVYEG